MDKEYWRKFLIESKYYIHFVGYELRCHSATILIELRKWSFQLFLLF